MIRENEKCLETFKANRGILITCTWCNNYYYVCFRFCKYHIIHNVIRCELEYLFDFKLTAKCNPNSKASITNEIVIFSIALLIWSAFFSHFYFCYSQNYLTSINALIESICLRNSKQCGVSFFGCRIFIQTRPNFSAMKNT